MDDGTPRLANTLPRRKKATLALRKAHWPASTSLCETLLAAASTWLDIRRGIVRAAERHIPRGSRDSPKKIWTHEMEQAEPAAEAAHEAHTLPHPETACFEPNVPEKGRNGIKPYAVAPLCFWKPARKDLEPHPARGGDIFTAWRRRTLILRNRLCSALILGPRMRSASATGKSACSSSCAGFTCHTALYCCCCCCTPLVPGGWEMDRPFPPYELDVAIRDSLLGSAPCPDNMLNEFLHRHGPVARGTIRTMIQNSFANGSLPEDSMSGSDDGDSSSPSESDISWLPLSSMVKKSDGEDSLGP
ncbi:hypothetical protein TcCL_Unassigned00683 [Trypanosoma cruzi]|nr:hypothetical protein TcCL_Unassigned00683 [Trypanosoma cruzi]